MAWGGTAAGKGSEGGRWLGVASDYHQFVLHAALATQADVVEHLGGVVVDVLEDSNVLQYLRDNCLPAGLTDAERRRVKRRARQYEMNGDTVVRMMADGTRRVVPPLNARVGLVQQTHAHTGHWGVRRTKALLLSSHWWQGLERDVAKVLANCEVCSQVKANFSVANPQLHPLPIGGLFYCWGVDLCGLFNTSKRGNEYVMVCIEHFSKHVELIALPDKSADNTAYAFLSHVVGRFGASAEVLTDRGAEFLGAFHQLLEECMIDHRTTSAQHPQADGLAERCVQTIKGALAKHVLQCGTMRDWDEHLHWIALGYRSSKQAASGLSPYQMMYGCEPCVPPAIKDRYRPGLALVFDTPDHREQAADFLLARSLMLQENCSIAMTNLRSAQHRDCLRFQRVRSGLYRPPMTKFSVGDYVYVKRQKVSNTLMSDARPGIFRVLQVRESGVLVLQGKCGSSMQVHQENCAPCMLMNIDHRLDHSLRKPGADECCVVCESDVDEAVMLMCDGCGKGYHTYCLQPPLAAIPDAIVWLCPNCEKEGVQVEPILRQREAAASSRPLEPAMFPNAAQRAADAVAARLDGQVIVREGGEGVLRFVAREDRPKQYSRRPFQLVIPGEVPVWYTEAAAQKLLAQSAAKQLTAAMAAAALGSVQFVAATTVAGGKLKKAAAAWQLSRQWRLDTMEGCELAGKELFGGLEREECAQLSCWYIRAKQVWDEGGDYIREVFPRADVRMLLGAVDLRSCMRLCTPCGPATHLQEEIAGRYAKLVMTTDAGMEAMLSPGFYQHVSRQSPLDWVFLSAPEGLQDVALAVAASAVAMGVAMLVHRGYVTSGSAHRQRMLQQFMDEGRLAVVSEQGTQDIWVCVFAAAGHLNSMCSLPRAGAFCEMRPKARE